MRSNKEILMKKIFYFSGTHWDREWYQTFQGFRLQLVDAIDSLIELLENDAEFSVFHLDGQTIVLEDYLEVRPEMKERLESLICRGRIVIGPWYCMPDEFLVSGEALIRNFQKGRSICKKIGVEPWKVGYICDIFGHVSQFPQILKNIGINRAVLGRGTNEHTTQAFFNWESPNGDAVTVFKLRDASGYGAYSMEVVGQRKKYQCADPESEEFAVKTKEYIDHEFSRYNGKIAVIADAMDHEPAHVETSKYIRKIAQLYPDAEVLHCNLMDAFDYVDKCNSSIETKRGELIETARDEGAFLHLLTHTLSSRQSIKARNDSCQSIMERGLEPLYLFLKSQGVEYSKQYLNLAWTNLLQNHPHDSICGCSVDRVHEEMKFRFSQVESIYEAICQDASRKLTNGYKRVGEGNILYVFNSMPKEEKQSTITMNLEFTPEYNSWQQPFGYQEIKAFRIFDESGKEVQYTIDKILTGGKVRTTSETVAPADIYTVTFNADLKPFGLTKFTIQEENKPVRMMEDWFVTDRIMDNGQIRVTLFENGKISIYDYKTNKTYSNLLGFADSSEIGDGWNSVGLATDEAIVSAKSVVIRKKKSSKAKTTFTVDLVYEVPKAVNYGHYGPERSEELCEMRIKHEISLCSSNRYVNVKTTVDNNAKDHILRLSFDNGISDRYFVNQIFDFVERKCGVDVSTSNWKENDCLQKNMQGIVGVRDENSCGLAFVSAGGLHECGVTKHQIEVTLLRSFSKTYTTNGEVGGQENYTHSYEYVLHPIDENMDYTYLQNIQNKLSTKHLYFISKNDIENKMTYNVEGDVCISSFKPCVNGDGKILRLFNLEDKNKEVLITVNNGEKLYKCDFYEENDVEIDKKIEVKAHEIITIKIKYIED